MLGNREGFEGIERIFGGDATRTKAALVRSSPFNDVSFQNLKKIPAHLAAVISDPPVRYNDLAKLIAWCHEAGIFYVTLYDFDGELVRRAIQRFPALIPQLLLANSP